MMSDMKRGGGGDVDNKEWKTSLHTNSSVAGVRTDSTSTLTNNNAAAASSEILPSAPVLSRSGSSQSGRYPSTWTAGHAAYMERLASIRAASLPRFMVPPTIDSLSTEQLFSLPPSLLKRALKAFASQMTDNDIATVQSIAHHPIPGAAPHTSSAITAAHNTTTGDGEVGIGRLPPVLLSTIFSFLDGSDEVLGRCYLVSRAWMTAVQLPSSCTSFDDMRYPLVCVGQLVPRWLPNMRDVFVYADGQPKRVHALLAGLVRYGKLQALDVQDEAAPRWREQRGRFDTLYPYYLKLTSLRVLSITTGIAFDLSLISNHPSLEKLSVMATPFIGVPSAPDGQKGCGAIVVSKKLVELVLSSKDEEVSTPLRLDLCHAGQLRELRVKGLWLLENSSEITLRLTTIEMSMLDSMSTNTDVTTRLMTIMTQCITLTRLRLNGGVPVKLAPAMSPTVGHTLEQLNLRSVRMAAADLIQVVAQCVSLRRLGVPLQYPLEALLDLAVVPRLEVLAVELHRNELFYRPPENILTDYSWPLPIDSPDTLTLADTHHLVYLVHDRHEIYCRMVPLTRSPICAAESSMTVIELPSGTIRELITRRALIIVMAGFLECVHRYSTCGCNPTYISWPSGVGEAGDAESSRPILSVTQHMTWMRNDPD